ncbi:MAG TPA: hypothetical protein PLC37_00205 [Smithellaceae bacterium]|nr:hypothetical protein [Smithellaceae bacterium]HQG79420.1 hypothetical protein [Smithellaceae bacterium]
MGFVEVYKYILSYFGIGILGIGILLSIGLIIPACYWLFTCASANRGAAVFRRVMLVLVIMLISFSYVRAPFFYEIHGWWKVTFWLAFAAGVLVPVFMADTGPADRRPSRMIIIMSCLWWVMLIFSEALLVSGMPYQAVTLYIFIAVGGLFCGTMIGTSVSQTLKGRISESQGAAI